MSGAASGEDETTGSAPDLGVVPDFGDGAPVGCKGKVDFLFMISRHLHMQDRQEQLAKAFPQFIATIESKFADFDYHIMVVDGDDTWGAQLCTDFCPDPLACKIGAPCCPVSDPDYHGLPCCDVPEYPCADLDLVDPECDYAWGAGTKFPAGSDSSNRPCAIDGDRRYLVKGQTDLEETFTCIATVGSGGDMHLGEALTAAVQKPINDWGCNAGFLRRDALLMVTFIAANLDEPPLSSGTIHDWAQAVRDAKLGDDRAVVMFNIGRTDEEPGCHKQDRLCQFVKLFPFHQVENWLVTDYGPAFAAAADLVEEACAGYVPPE